MQVILDSSFARPGSAPIWGGKKGEFRDWTREYLERYYVFAKTIHQDEPLFFNVKVKLLITEALDKQLRIKISGKNCEWRFDESFIIFKFVKN